jgi:hypothetical protein
MRFCLLLVCLTSIACSPSESDDVNLPAVGFGSFGFVREGGPCAPGADCIISLRELRFDGRLVTKYGEATVSQTELDSAVSVLTDPALVALLRSGPVECSEPDLSDYADGMYLTLDGDTLVQTITECQDPPIVAARATLGQLVDVHL